MADARARAEPTPDALRHRTDTAARRKAKATIPAPAVVLPEPVASPVEVWEPLSLPVTEVEEDKEFVFKPFVPEVSQTDESPAESGEEVDGTQEF